MMQLASLGLEMGYSPARRLSVIVALTGGLLVFSEAPQASGWLGQWCNTGLYLTVFSFAIAGTIAAVAGHLIGSDLVNTRRHWMLRSPQPLRRLVGPPLLSGALWMTLGTSAVHVAGYLRTMAVNPVIEFRAAYLSGLGIASMLEMLCFGFLMGVMTRRRSALILTGSVPYALTILSGQVSLGACPSASSLMAPIIDQRWDPNLAPRFWTLLVLGIYTATVALALVMFATLLLARSAHSSPPWRALLPVASFCALTAFAVMAAWSPNGFASPRRIDYSCAAIGSSSYCIWSTQRYQGNIWRAALEDYEKSLADFPAARIRFLQYGLPAETPYDHQLDEHAATPQRQDLVRSMIQQRVRSAFPGCGDNDVDRIVSMLDLTADPPGSALRAAQACA